MSKGPLIPPPDPTKCERCGGPLEQDSWSCLGCGLAGGACACRVTVTVRLPQKSE